MHWNVLYMCLLCFFFFGLQKSEIERLSVWQNPGGLAELAISGTLCTYMYMHTICTSCANVGNRH